MYSRRVIYALGIFFLFICRSSLAVDGVPAVNYPFYSTPSGSIPIYCLFGTYVPTRSSSFTPYLSLSYTSFDKWSATGASVANPTVSSNVIEVAIIKYLYSKSSIVGASALNDYDSSYSSMFFLQLPSNLSITNLGFTPSSVNEYAVTLKLSGKIFIRNVNTDSSINVNTLSSRPSSLYDVFFFFTLAPSASNMNTSYVRYTSSSSPPKLYFDTNYQNVNVDYSYTPLLYGSFRYDVENDRFVSIDDRFGLPFRVGDGERVIYFCNGSSGYWSFGAGDVYPLSNFSSMPSPFFVPQIRPLFNNLFIQTVNSSFLYRGLSDDPQFASNYFFNLDSDNGSLADVKEWYQTKHNLLDPSDDRQNTPEIEPPAEDLPEPEEGESVVDIGKDTVDRYGHYWDEQVGDYFDLEPIQPPTSSPEPPAFNFEQFDVESISRRVRGNLEETGLESSMETVFSPLSSSDTPINLTFTPTVDFSSLGSTLQLNTLDLNPSNVLGMNSRSVSEAAQKFKIFRLFLLVAEILLFGYSCFKLVFNMLSPGNSDSGSQQGEE